MTSIVVLKFGGSFLRGHADLVCATHAIYREVREGRRVVAVTSAFYGRTDELVSTIDGLEEETRGAAGDRFASCRKRAALLGTGEVETAALLAATLERSGVPARVADVRSIGPFVQPLDEESSEANEPATQDACVPTRMNLSALKALLDEAPVVCLPGFIAAEDSAERHPALLGRGGSDLTAVFVADALSAPVVLVKDVEGLYSSDPSSRADEAGAALPRRLAHVSYADAKGLEGNVLQRRALEFAERKGLEIHVVGPGALVGERGTTVGAAPTSDQPPTAARRPLRVALLGLGTVGARVFAELSSAPHLYEVTAVLVRRGPEVQRPTAARSLLVPSIEEVLASDPELVIDLTGGAAPAASWIARLLRDGRHVVTANKAAVARAQPWLGDLARQHDVQFLCSAAVGGSIPALEAVARAAEHGASGQRLVGITGVLNSTSNAILESVRGGSSWEEALQEAREAGLAEADPTSDLDGSDIACKLELLARAAGWLDGPREELRWFQRDTLAEGVPGGIGAGAWPTATSVMGDVFELRRRLRQRHGGPVGTPGDRRWGSNRPQHG